MIRLTLKLHDGTTRSGTYPESDAKMRLDAAIKTNQVKDFSMVWVGE